jgi:hypothetical protein
MASDTNSTRLETLRRIAAQRPSDPFPRYGLAMELRRVGELEQAANAFAELEATAPDYVPGYLMHGQVLVALGRKDAARGVMERGRVVAAKKGDAHAGSELASALSELAELAE